MSRTEWFLGGFLALLVVVVLVALLVIWRQDSVPDVEQTKIPINATAVEAYQAADPIAKQWSADAQLLNARSMWEIEGGLDNVNKLGWTMVFYSPGREATVLVSVAQGQASLLNVRPTEKTYALAATTEWQIDSDVLTTIVADNEMQSLLNSMQKGQFIMSLDMSKLTSKWTVTAIDTEQQRAVSLIIHAGNGIILEAE